MSTLTSYLLSSGSGSAPRIPHMIGDMDAPKLKFLFTVEFGFRSMAALRGHRDLVIAQYDLKSASRPNITVNQEDVNYYGYRAKVGTRINFGTIRLTFYEDSLNTASDLMWNYIRQISPLTQSISHSASVTTVNDEVDVQGIGGSTTIGPLASGSEDGPIKWMKIHHHYLSGQDTKKITTYHCINPKIESVELDELDMSASDASTISITFTYEALAVLET